LKFNRPLPVTILISEQIFLLLSLETWRTVLFNLEFEGEIVGQDVGRVEIVVDFKMRRQAEGKSGL